MAVDVGSAVGYLDLDVSGFLAGLRTAQNEADSATKNMVTKVGGGLKTVGDKITSAGSTLTKTVTLPLAGIATAGLKVATDFEKAMSQVQAVSGATGEEFDSLREKAIELGADTAFSSNEVAEAMTEMAKAGWTSQQILDGMSGVLDAAAASGEGLGSVATIVADAITGFGLEAKESTRVADLLTQAANAGTIGIDDLGESFKYIAPMAATMGFSIEDVTTAISAMSMAGIKGSQAGTSLRTALVRMVKPNENTAAAMEELGIVLTNTDGSFKSLDQIVSEMRTSFNGLTDEQQTYYAATLAGQEGMSGLLSLLNLTQEEYDVIADSMNNASGVAAETAAVMQDNLAAKVEQLGGSLESLAIKLADYVIPHLQKFVLWLTDLVDKFAELDPETQKSILKWGAFAIALGPALMTVGKLTSGIGGVITMFGKAPAVFGKLQTGLKGVQTGFVNINEGFALSKAGFPAMGAEASKLGAALAGVTAPMIALVAVIAILVAAFATLWKTNEDFRNKMIAIWTQIKKTVSKFLQGIVDRVNALGFDFKNITDLLWAIWKGFCDLLAPVFEGVFQQIANILDVVFDVILGILDIFIGLFTGNWEQVWEGVKGIFKGVWDFLVATFQNYVNVFTGILDTVCGWFGTTWENTWNAIKQFFVDIWNGIVSFFTNTINNIKTAVSNFIQAIINFFAQLPTNIANFITQAWNSVVQWSANMVNKAREMGQNFLNNVVEFFTNLPYKVGYFIGNTLTNIALWVTNMVDKAKEMGTDFLNQTITFFQQLPGKVLQFITSAFQNVQSWATNMRDKANETGTNFLNEIISFFQQLPGKVLQFITSALGNVKTWVTNMAAQAIKMGTNFINNVVSFLKQLPGKVKGFLDSAIEKVKNWVSDIGRKGKEAIESLISNIVDGAKAIPGKMVEIGTNIVEGVWDGIQDAVSWFTDKVEGFFSGIVDGVQDALDINSPSKVFAKEVGRWLPAGVAEGFERGMPAAMKDIQTALNNGVDSVDADDISITAKTNVETFSNKLKNIYEDVATWFETIESRIGGSIERMTESLANFIYAGRTLVNPDGTIGYVGYNGFNPFTQNNPASNNTQPVDGGEGDTFIFNSPKPIDEIEAARQMKKTKRDLSEGF